MYLKIFSLSWPQGHNTFEYDYRTWTRKSTNQITGFCVSNFA